MSNLKYQMGGYTPTNLQQASFIPTYAGTPLEDAQKYGTDLLNTYKSNITDLTKLDIANAQRRVIEGDTAESAKYDQQLKTQFEEMARKGDYENMSSQVNELARRHVNDKGLKTMAESRAVADAEDSLIQQLHAKGITPWFVKDKTAHKSVSIDDKGNKIYNVYKATAETPMEHTKIRQDIWNPVVASMGPLSATQVDKIAQAIPGYIATGRWGGISDTTITNKLEHAINIYKNTPSYDQDARHEMELDPNITREQANKLVEGKLLSEGMMKTFSNTDVNYLRNHNLEDAIKAGALNPSTLPTAHADTRGMFNPDVDTMDDVTEDGVVNGNENLLKDKKTGKVLSAAETAAVYNSYGNPTTRALKTIFGSEQPAAQQYAFLDETEMKTATDERTKAIRKQTADTNLVIQKVVSNNITDQVAAASILEQYPGWNTMDSNSKSKALVYIQKEVAKNRVNVQTPVMLAPKEVVVDEGQMVNYINNLGVMSGKQLSLGIPKEQGGGSYDSLDGWDGVQKALQQYAKQKGLATGDKLTYSAIKQGISGGNPYIPGAAVTLITIQDTKGNTTQVPLLAAPNKELQRVMGPLNTSWKIANSGKMGEFPVHWPALNENIIIENYPTHENGNWENKTRVKLPDSVADTLGLSQYVNFDTFSAIWEQYNKNAIDTYGNNFIQ